MPPRAATPPTPPAHGLGVRPTAPEAPSPAPPPHGPNAGGAVAGARRDSPPLPRAGEGRGEGHIPPGSRRGMADCPSPTRAAGRPGAARGRAEPPKSRAAGRRERPRRHDRIHGRVAAP